MSDIYGYEQEKKDVEEPAKKKSKGGFKKVIGTICLAVLFGICASIVFNGTNIVIEKFSKKPNKSTIEKFEDVAPPKEEKKNGNIEAFNKGDTYSEEEKEEPKKEKKQIQTLLNDDDKEGTLSVEQVAAECMPSIVAITNQSLQEFRSFYGSGIQQFESESAGSGIIIGQSDTELLIATNAHVISNAETLTVCFIDGEAYEAKAKGADDGNDIAVIAVSLSDVKGSTLDEIKIAKIGKSKDLVIGQQVVAIGNAMGYGQSVTTGIVSALDRTIDGSDEGTSYIQTDAAINPGNSGGALLNMYGELVGINSAKLANTKIEGMGYAIPIDSANSIIENLMNFVTREKVEEKDAGYIGISGFSVTDDVAMAYSIPKGIYVSETTEGAAAERAGIQKGDVIISFDGMNVDSIKKLRDRLDYYKAGETVDVVVARADDGEYKEKTLHVTLDSREGTPLDASEEEKDKEEPNSEQEPEDDNNNQIPNQRSGEFNFGGSKFQYSLPDNIFDIFGR